MSDAYRLTLSLALYSVCVYHSQAEPPAHRLFKSPSLIPFPETPSIPLPVLSKTPTSTKPMRSSIRTLYTVTSFSSGFSFSSVPRYARSFALFGHRSSWMRMA